MGRHLPCLLALMALSALAQALPDNSFLDKKLVDWRRELETGEKPAIRRSAAFALGRIGPTASFALDELARALRRDGDDGVRDMAACAIGDIALSIKQYRPAREWEVVGKSLQDALTKDTNPRVRRSAAYAIGAFGDLATPALPTLLGAFQDKHAPVRQNTIWAIGRVGRDPSVLTQLCEALKDDGPLVRRDAASALEELGRRLGFDKVRPAAQPLLRLIAAERDDVVRKTALGALALLTDESHRDMAPDLYPLLTHKDADTARKTAYVLGSMGGEPAIRALPALRAALGDGDPGVQALAAATLTRAGPPAGAATDDLARVLSLSKHHEVRRNCAIALGQIADAAASRRGIALEDLSSRVLPALLEAVRTTVDATADPARVRAADEVRVYAAEAISRIGQPHINAALPTIHDLLVKDGNQEVRHHCVEALLFCRELEKYGLVKVLTAILDEKGDDRVSARYAAARTLALSLNDKAPDRTCDVLLEMLRDTSIYVNPGSQAAIEGAGAEGSAAASRAAPGRGGDGRFMAAQALGVMGEKARKNKDVMNALRKAATEPEPRLKDEATKALNRLEE